MLSLALTFLHEWLTFGLAGVALIGAAACYFRLPLFGKEAAILLVAVAVGLSAYSKGYAVRAEQDKSADLRARIEVMERDKAIADAVAADADARAQASDTQKELEHDKAESLASELAAAHRDCAIPDDVRERLRGIGTDDQQKPATPARTVRATRAQSPVLKRGAFATIATYRVALNEANRRLRNDLSFYEDVRRRYGGR